MTEQPQNKKKFPRTFLFIGIIILLLLIRFSYSGDNSFESVMKGTAIELNKTCPQMMDKETRLDSASIHENKTFRYYYTLLNSNKDSMEIDLFFLSVEPLMINNAKTNPDLQLFRDNKVILEYYFRDELGRFLTRIAVGPDRYKK